MRTFKERPCKICTTLYIPTGSCSKYCVSCSDEQHKLRIREGTKKWYIKQGRKVGVGKGGCTGSGKENPNYKNGIGIFHKVKHRVKQEKRYCERCSKDLIGATKWEWCMHHKDHDRANNDESNFELLCKRCHQIEHDCIKAVLEGATTKVMRDKVTGRFKRIEAPDNQ